MAWSFRKSIKLGCGIIINLSKRGIGLTAAVRGARAGVGPRGVYRSLSVPGTGLYNRKYTTEKKS